MKKSKISIIGLFGLLVVFIMFGLGACATLGDIFYVPATTPEGYGRLTIQNNDARQDGAGNPVTGYGIRTINVNGITNRTYSKSYTYGNLPGRVPSPMGWLAGGFQTVGDEIVWVDIKNGVEKEVKKELIPLGDYEITIGWSTGQQTRHRVSVTKTSSRTLLVTCQ